MTECLFDFEEREKRRFRKPNQSQAKTGSNHFEHNTIHENIQQQNYIAHYKL